MASRYWVAGGTGNWSSTTNWSSTSGGASGASVPTSADDVFVDVNSGTSPTITVDVSSSCLSLDFTGSITPTLAGVQILNVFGNLIFISTMTVSYTGTMVFQATSAKNITTAGKSLNFTMSFNSTTGDWTLLDNVTNTATNGIDVVNGILRMNNRTVTTTKFTSNYTTTRTIDMTNVTLSCSTAFTIGITGLTLTVTGSSITMSGNTQTFAGGGGTYNNVTFSGTPITVTGSNTFNIVTIAAGKTLNITAGTTQIVNNIVSNGTTSNLVTIKSLTAASAATISTGSAIVTSCLIVQDITKAGAGSITLNLSQNTSGNTGITFNANLLYWISGTGNFNDSAHWSLTSGGTTSGQIPASYIGVKFDSASFTGASQTVTVNVASNCLSMDWTGATNNPTLTGNSNLTISGNVTFILAMTANMGGNIQLFASGSLTTNGLTLQCNITCQATSGTVNLQDDITTTGTIAFANGTFNSNNKNITASTVNVGSGTNTVTVNFGSSTITCSSNYTVTASVNLTINAGTSTINMTGTTKTFAGGVYTFYILKITGSITITGSNTFTGLTVLAGGTLKLTSGTTQTVTNLISNGTVASPSTIQAVTAGSAATLAMPAGRYFMRHTSCKDLTISGATSMTDIAGTDASGNTGITFVTKFEMGRIKNDGSFNWYSAATGSGAKVSG